MVIESGPFGSDNLTAFSTEINQWIINDQGPAEIGWWSYPYDEGVDFDQYDGAHLKVYMRHHVYLKLKENFVQNKAYNITSDFGSISFTFDQNNVFCESIKTNQVGYNEHSTIRYANFGIYAGNLKHQELDSLRHYAVIDTLTKNIVAEGDLSFWGIDTGVTLTASGEYVYRIDVSSVPKGGPYTIVIDGIGKSHPFGIGDEYLREIAKVHARGMYHQRCGIALEEPYTQYTRNICHTEAAFTKEEWGAGTWIHVPEGAEMHTVIGGYHDAGDYDRRPMHTIIPILMFNFYEVFPENFIDDQYDIPESGNDIPDFLDEGLWGMLIWENLQLDSSNSSEPSEYGGVMMGTETHEHPGYGRDRADTDTRTYGTFGIGVDVTLDAIGLFAQAARLLKPYDSEKSERLLHKALLSWNYISKQEPDSMRSGMLYASLQMYLATATGDSREDLLNEYHQIFIDQVKTYIIDNGYWPHQYSPGNSASKIKASHFISYLITNNAVDASTREALYKVLESGADGGGYMGWTSEEFPYPQGVTKFMAWGASTAQGRYAEAPAFMIKLSENQADKQRYVNIVSQFSDYSLGLNPLGQSYVTGLGTRQVQSPLHLDSWFTKMGLTPDGGPQPTLGNVPGIVIYGPTYTRSGVAYQTLITDQLYPAWDDQPGQRRWADGWSAVNNNEFTTWETQVWNTCMFGALYNAGNHTVDTPITPDTPDTSEILDTIEVPDTLGISDTSDTSDIKDTAPLQPTTLPYIQLQVFPDYVEITPNNNDISGTLILLNVNGQIVFQKKWNSESMPQLNTSELSSGFYLLTISHLNVGSFYKF